MKKVLLAMSAWPLLFACSKSQNEISAPLTLAQPPVATAAVAATPSVDTVYLKKSTDNTVYISNASSIKPGSVLVLQGSYLSVQILNLQGTSDKPIKIINKGQVTIGGYQSYNVVLTGKYFKLLGNGDASIKYGIKFVSKDNNTYGNFGLALGASSNVEVARCEFTHLQAGILQNPSTGTAPLADCYYHDNYFHDFNNPTEQGRSEVFYLGNTGGVAYNAVFRFVNCRIENNLIENVSGDGIQMANGTFICKNNTIRNHGLAQLDWQRSGILLGGNASGKIQNNVVTGGKGVAIQVLGVGDVEVSGNTVSNISVSNLVNEDLVYINSKGNASQGTPTFKLSFLNNSIQGAANRFGICNVTATSMSAGAVFTGNKVSGTYLKPYAISSIDKWTN